jgi:hypothetical protein
MLRASPGQESDVKVPEMFQAGTATRQSASEEADLTSFVVTDVVIFQNPGQHPHKAY